MKKIVSALLTLVVSLSLFGCGANDVVDKIADGIKEEVHVPVTIKESNDKHLAYIKDYVGKNCAMIGYTSMAGDRNDYLGSGYLELVLVTNDGTYVDIDDDEALKEYVVVAQSLEPNTEVMFEFDSDSEGNEYNFPKWQGVNEIVLYVKKVKEANLFSGKPTRINPSTDHHVGYVPDLVGRNLNATGYTSMAGDRRIEIGNLYFKLNIVTADGSFIDIDDEEALKQYVVYAQGLEPNTELQLEFDTNSKGEEYSFVKRANYEEMDIYVKLIEE